MLPGEVPSSYNVEDSVMACYGSMWVIFGHSAVFPKKSGQLKLELVCTPTLATRPEPI